MVRKFTTVFGVLIVVILGAFQVADAQAARTPSVQLRCDHGTAGCAGMAGDFAAPDGGAIETVAIEVHDIATGRIVDVTTDGCEVTTRDGTPSTIQVHCMIEGAAFGIAGDITWSVVINGVVVWTSPVTPTRCDAGPTTTTTTVAPDTGGVEPPGTTTTTTATTTTTTIASPPPATTTTVPDDQTVIETTMVSSTTSTPPDQATTTTVVTLVSPTGSAPPPATTAADTADEEILPVTGVSLGALGGAGAMMLALGLGLEAVSTRRRMS